MSSKQLNYDKDPPRHPSFIVNAPAPFNAEPPNEVLVRGFITPNEHFFVRNHGPVPELDESKYRFTVEGLVHNPLSLTLQELKDNFEKVTVMASLQCAGNRRNELSVVKKVKGVGWGTNAVSNAVWSGVRLCDVLKLAGVRDDAQHIAFESIEEVVEDNFYGSSIPLDKATDETGDVLLAYEMNGVPLPRDHGHPLRVVVPGHIGARSVKWLKRILVQTEESPNFFQSRDYKLFIPQVDVPVPPEVWNAASSLQEFGVQSAILEPRDGTLIRLLPASPTSSSTPTPTSTSTVTSSPVTIKGYALTGGGRRIERVDVSIDGGKTWKLATLFREAKNPKKSKNSTKRNWAWTLWYLQLEEGLLSQVAEKRRRRSGRREEEGEEEEVVVQVVCRAWDSSANTQPERPDSIWNFRGLHSNPWHRITLYLPTSSLPLPTTTSKL